MELEFALILIEWRGELSYLVNDGNGSAPGEAKPRECTTMHRA